MASEIHAGGSCGVWIWPGFFVLWFCLDLVADSGVANWPITEPHVTLVLGWAIGRRWAPQSGLGV